MKWLVSDYNNSNNRLTAIYLSPTPGWAGTRALRNINQVYHPQCRRNPHRHSQPSLQASQCTSRSSDITAGIFQYDEIREWTVIYRIHFIVCLMSGHRFDDTKGLRRRKITHHSAMASIVHIGQIDAAVKSQPTQPRKRTHYLESEPHKVCMT